MSYAFLCLGFLLLLIGSEAVLRGGVELFRALGLPSFFVAVLIGAFAMSAPELSVAMQASVRGMPDIALGDIAGSSIANILLVFGLGALLHPMPAPPRTVFRDSFILIVASFAFTFIALSGYIAQAVGGCLLAGWFGYLVLAYVTDWGRPAHLLPSDMQTNGGREYGGALSIFLVAVGVVCLFFGARLAIDFALLIARNFHVPQTAVALTLVAFGTSLPELVAILRGAGRKGTNGMSGKIIASSIFNILFVLGISALLRPMSVAPMLGGFDVPILAVCAVLLSVLMLFGWRLTRFQGALLLAGYIAYIVSVGLRSGVHLHG